MFHRIRGILLHTSKYTDNSLIIKLYTEQFGIQAYIIQGIRGKKAKIKANILQPLVLLEGVATNNVKTSLQRISELRVSQPFSTIPYDITKSSILLFLNEVLYKTLREEEANPELFEFLFHAIQLFDLKTEGCANFHLLFMFQLSKYLGFFPQGNYSEETSVFNLKEGVFQSAFPDHGQVISFPLSRTFARFSSSNFEHLHQMKITNQERKELLLKLIEYYELHMVHSQKFTSHQVLETVVA